MSADCLPVAAYCRVSTDSPDQSQSLRSQTGFFQDYIQGQPHWRLTRIYVDAADIIGLNKTPHCRVPI